jgi:hypothetical protein
MSALGQQRRFAPFADPTGRPSISDLLCSKFVRQAGRITSCSTSGSVRNARSCQNYPNAYRDR